MLANSSVYKKITNEKLLPGQEIQVQCQQLRTFPVGDSAYPLLPLVDKAISVFKMTDITAEEMQLQAIASKSYC